MRDNEFNLFTYENWRDVAGFEGLYQVSTHGRVRSLDRMVWNEHNQAYSLYKGRILRPTLGGWGYQYVYLYKDGKKKACRVHRLVAQAFIPNPQRLPQVNHINEVKTNNRVENLEWCTQEYNHNYGTINERIAKANTNGIRSKRLMQISPQTNEIVKIWQSTQECQRNGFNSGNISLCCQGKRKTHKGYRWSYVE